MCTGCDDGGVCGGGLKVLPGVKGGGHGFPGQASDLGRGGGAGYLRHIAKRHKDPLKTYEERTDLGILKRVRDGREGWTKGGVVWLLWLACLGEGWRVMETWVQSSPRRPRRVAHRTARAAQGIDSSQHGDGETACSSAWGVRGAGAAVGREASSGSTIGDDEAAQLSPPPHALCLFRRRE